jgi:hypothetical protein
VLRLLDGEPEVGKIFGSGGKNGHLPGAPAASRGFYLSQAVSN